MDDAHDGLTLRHLQNKVMFHVPEEVQIRAAGVFSGELDELPDVDALTLGIPAFVIVAGREVGGDALALWPVLDEVVDLVLESVHVNVELVEPSLSVDHVPSLVNVGDALLFPDVEQCIQHVQTLVVGAEVVVAGDTDLEVPTGKLLGVDDRRLAVGDFAGNFQLVLTQTNVLTLVIEGLDGLGNTANSYVEVVRELNLAPALLRLVEQSVDCFWQIGCGALGLNIRANSASSSLLRHLPNVLGGRVKLPCDTRIVAALPRLWRIL